MQAFKSRFVLLVLLAVPSVAIWAEQPPPERAAVQTEMKNINYHFTDEISVSIRHLEGALLPVGGTIPVFDDKHSFIIAIRSAEIVITADALSRALNTVVFSGRDVPIKDLSITTNKDGLNITGKLADKGNIPFQLQGALAPTPDGKIRIHAAKVKAAHIPAKGLMDLLGVKISDLVKTKKVRGVVAAEDDLILDPEQLLPPPAIRGRVTQVRIEGNSIVQVFGRRDAGASPRVRGAGNYMVYRGATLRFGKLTMSDTDLELIDMDPRDAFDFDLDHYRDQLVAGYTKTTPQFGLHVFMRDYNKLKRRPRQQKP